MRRAGLAVNFRAMSKAAQLKKKGSEFEQKKQYDKAVASYVQAVEASAGLPDEIDIPLYNRVGDLYLRLGDLEQALTYYEMAVDLYAEGGFFNNAIALCNKVLRHVPSRAAIYYKLGKISARKGFNSDAKQNFLEYSSRMQNDGQVEEAFRALKEFVDLVPGQDDVRLMLAEQLGRAGRKDEALEQLHIVYDTMVAEDRTTEAAATLERMKAIDPAAEPRGVKSQRQTKREGLVFIDVNYEAPPTDLLAVEAEIPLLPNKPPVSELRAVEPDTYGQVDLEAGSNVLNEHSFDTSAISGLIPLDDPEEPLMAPAAPVDDGLDMQFSAIPSIVDSPTSFDSFDAPAPPLAFLPQDEPSSAGGISAPASDDDVVDLQTWLNETESPKPAAVPDANSPSAFAEMLASFKRGVAESMDDGDSDSHYDLGVAYMEMGLLGDAISQFQQALRTAVVPDRRVRAYESLGQCLVEQHRYDSAMVVLRDALEGTELRDDKLVGVLYLAGYASESLGQWDDAAAFYARVFASDMRFRDTAERLRRANEAIAVGEDAPATGTRA